MAVEPTACLETGEKGRIDVGTSIPFDVIHDPGAYICNWSGHLLRIHSAGLDPEHESSPINLVGSEPLLVTKISDNPYIAVGRARSIATGLALAVNF